MDPSIIALYDEYTHAPLPRRTFLERLAVLAGGSAAAAALLPLLENNYALAAVVAPDDARESRRARPTSRCPAARCAPTSRRRATVPAKRGGVVVIHENRGLDAAHRGHDATRRARRLHGRRRRHAVAAGRHAARRGQGARDDRPGSTAARRSPTSSRVVDWLAARPDANGKVGAVGFCWGGGMVNALATASPRLAAAVPFYGVAAPAADVPKIRAKLLIHYAGNDPRINAGIPEYETALKAANVDYRQSRLRRRRARVQQRHRGRALTKRPSWRGDGRSSSSTPRCADAGGDRRWAIGKPLDRGGDVRHRCDGTPRTAYRLPPPSGA